MPKVRSKEPKAIMSFEVGTLNTLLRYAMCTSISKSSVAQLHKLIEELDFKTYAYQPDVLVRLKAIKYVSEARMSYNMKDPEVIRSYIVSNYPDGQATLDDIEPLIADTLQFSETTAIGKIVHERLEYLYIFKYKDTIVNCMNKFAMGGWTSYYDTIDEVKTVLQQLLTNIASTGQANVGLVRRLNLSADNYRDIVDHIITKAKMPTAVLQTGIRQLNAILAPGFQADRLYLILGLTGRFKSGTLLNIADQICRYNKHIKAVEDGRRKTVLFISNENTIEETYARFVDMFSGLNDDIVRMNPDEAMQFIRDNGGYRFSDDQGITIEFRYYRNLEMSTADIYTLINELADEGYQTIAVILDYIGRVRSVTDSKEERFRLANIAKELKSIATFFGIPVITAQQVNREGNGIIDAAMRDDKADLAKFIGATAVSEAYGLIYEADWVALVNLEKRKSDSKWFLTFNRLKYRGKTDPLAVTYFNHPFIDEKRIRLDTDVDKQFCLSVVSLANDLENIPQNQEPSGPPRLNNVADRLNGDGYTPQPKIVNGGNGSIMDNLDLTGTWRQAG